MSALAARNKPFRYAQAKQVQNQTIKNGNLSQPPAYTSGIAASASHLAFCVGKGSILALPSALGGGFDPFQQVTPMNALPSINIAAHASDVADLAFSPFEDHLLASVGTEGLLKIWDLTEAAQGSQQHANISTATQKFEGFESGNVLAWHPTASHVLSVGSRQGLHLYDLHAEKEALTLKVEGFGKDVIDSKWNYNGSLNAIVTKNFAFGVFDPRSSSHQSNILASTQTSTYMKKIQHSLFIQSSPVANTPLPTAASSSTEYLLNVGISAGHRPCLEWFDLKNMSKPIHSFDFDLSQGFTIAQYDRDTNLLFFTTRGSSIISIFDIDSDKNKPSLWPVSSFQVNSNTKGFTLLPKRAVYTQGAEVDRLFSFSGEAIETYSINVPRKIAGFHAELYPDTIDAKAPNTSTDYFAGVNKEPVKISMTTIHEHRINNTGLASLSIADKKEDKPAASPTAATSTTTASASSTRTSSTSISTSSSSSSSSSSAAASSAPGVTRATSTSVSYTPSNTRATIDSKLKKSSYVHCQGVEPPSIHQTYFDLKLASVLLSLGENLSTNSSYFAVPWKALGGSAIAVFPHGKPGRYNQNFFCIRGHKNPAHTFAFDSFEPERIATTADGQIWIWRIPAGGLTRDLNENDEVLRLISPTATKVTSLHFHPFVKNLVVAATTGFDGHFIECWDVSDESAKTKDKPDLVINVHAEPIIDISLHPYTHLAATTSKDGKTRVVNLHSSTVLSEWTPPEHLKDTRVVWVGEHHVITTGFSAGGQRSISLFNTKENIGQVLCTVELDRVNYLPLPRYDWDSKLLFLANYGGTQVPLYEINTVENKIEYLNVFSTSTDITGFVLLPKSTVDVKKVEIVKALKLTKDALLPISYTVPRKRLEFFQDDLYPHGYSVAHEDSTAKTFFAGTHKEKGLAPLTKSLKPEAMTNLSEAPEEELTERQIRYQNELNAKNNTNKVKGATGHTNADEVKQHFASVAKTLPGTNRWDAKQDNSRQDVADDEWD